MSNNSLMKISKEAFEEYLSSLYDCKVTIKSFRRIGETQQTAELKGFGYGFPYIIEFIANGLNKRVVLETMRPDGFGHEHFSDRAHVLLWQNYAFNRLPKHVHSVDVGGFEQDSRLKSVGKCTEFFILTEFVDGSLYHKDLDKIRDTGVLAPLDKERCLALSNYLVEIHRLKHDAPNLYVRRIRELVGHGECIMGLLDSYPSDFKGVSESYFVRIEKKCVDWRWRLKKKTHRLSQVHGDFHPWNVLFLQGTDFTVLDRSRGEWGEPADDLAALTINYLFYSLMKHGQIADEFESLFRLFWDNYLEKTNDFEVLSVIPPFYAWRGLVIASPVWYPNISVRIRTKLFKFVENVLGVDKFDVPSVNSYFE